MTNKSLASSQLQLEMHIKVILICLFVFFQFYELSCNYWNSSDNKNHIQNLFLNEIMKKMKSTKEAGIFDSKSIVRKFEKDEIWKSKYEVEATNVVVNKAYGECPGHDKNWVRVYGMHSCYLWYEYGKTPNENEDVTWFWARDYCEKNGGRLYEPYSKTKTWRNELYLGKFPNFVT